MLSVYTHQPHILSITFRQHVQVPPIDSSSEEGLKPEGKFEATIELKNVNFTYPARPSVQVSVFTVLFHALP